MMLFARTCDVWLGLISCMSRDSIMDLARWGVAK